MQELSKKDNYVAFLELDLLLQKVCETKKFQVVRKLLHHPHVNPFTNENLGLKYVIEQGDTALENVFLESEKIVNSHKSSACCLM